MNEVYERMCQEDRIKFALSFLEQENQKYFEFANECLACLQEKFKVGDLVIDSRTDLFVVTEFVLPNKVAVDSVYILRTTGRSGREKKYDNFDSNIECSISRYGEKRCFKSVSLTLVKEAYVLEKEDYFENGKKKKQTFIDIYFGNDVENVKNVVRYKKLPLALVNY
jgi:hypothetical protein